MMNWFVFAVLSNLFDAAVGYLDEVLLSKLENNSDNGLSAPGQLLIISSLFGFVVAIIVLIHIALSTQTLALNTAAIVTGLSAGVLEVLWLIPYFYALNQNTALNTTPLFQTVPIFALFFGFFIFKEIPTVEQIFASLLIILGAIILNYSPQLHLIRKKSLLLMLLASSIISFGFYFFVDAAEYSNAVTALVLNGIGMGFTGAFIWGFWAPYRRGFFTVLRNTDRNIFSLQIANEGLYALSAVSNQFALILGPSVVAISSLNALHPLFTLLIGYSLAVFGIRKYRTEFTNNTAKNIIGICFIVIGAIFLLRV